MAACKARGISLSCSSLGLLPRISGSQNWPTAPFMCPIFPWDGGGALTHCDGSLPTPQTIYAWVSVLGVRCWGFIANVDGMGWVIREWRDEVLLGTTRFWSLTSRVTGLPSRSEVLGRWWEKLPCKDGAIFDLILELSRWCFNLSSWFLSVWGYVQTKL